jgi:AraC-like DNA-binding protein
MPEKLIYLLSALLGFITLFIIGFRFKTNRNTNFYLIVFLALSSTRFLIHGVSPILSLTDFQKRIDLIFVMIAWPLLYLYFSHLVYNHTTLIKKELVHFIIPVLLLILYMSKEYVTDGAFAIGWKMGYILEIFLNMGYAFASYKLLNDKVWKRNSDVLLINKQNKIIIQWTQLLFSLFAIMLLRFLISLTLGNVTYWYINQNKFLWLGALIWVVLYVKILYSPDFLYGYEVFQNKIREYKKHNIIFDNIWIMESSRQVTNIQDTVLKEKIASQIENYILAIEYLALNTNLFFAENFKTMDLALKLIIPKSHVLYIFKYHAAISFADFKKIIRIQKTILLMEEGYLKTNTMDSLALETGFTSYSSFFKSFKSITGLSPYEYCKNQ